jgi:MFS family permease
LADGVLTPLQRRQNLVAVTAAMAVTALIYGLSLPLLSLVMDARGVDSTLIGLSTAVQSVGIVLIAPFLPAHMRRSGLAVPMLGAILVSLVAFLLLPIFTSVGAWFVLRFVIGSAGGVLWVCGDTWVNEVADERIRGRVVSLYGVAVAGGFALGPLLLSVTGSDGFTPFLVSSSIMLLSALPLLPVVRIAPSMSGDQSGGMVHFLKLAPVPMLMGFIYAISEAILLTFLPLYGKAQGMAENQALYLIAVMGLGGMIGQFPIGWLADHMNRLLLGIICIVFVGLAAVAVPVVIRMEVWNMAFMLLIGAAATGVYTVGMVMIGERFKRADLASAGALYGLMFGAGSILGPPIGGAAMEYLPPHGVPLSIAVMFALFLPWPIIQLIRDRSRRSPR